MQNRSTKPMSELEEIAYVTKIAHEIGRNLRDDGVLGEGDLISEGWIALQEAKRRYDPCRGSALSTYAYTRVSGAMRDLIYRSAPRGYRRQGGTGEPLEVSVYEYHDSPVLDDMEGRVDLARVLAAVASRRLRSRERTIIIRRAAGEALRPLAAKYGVSRTRVCQIHREAAGKVRIALDRKRKRKIVVKKWT